MSPEIVSEAAGNLMNARDVATLACAFLLLTLLALLLVYLHARADRRDHAAALAKKDDEHAATLKAAHRETVALALRQTQQRRGDVKEPEA